MENYFLGSDKQERPIIQKRWGTEQIVVETKHYQVKRLFMRSGQCCSMHYHVRKHETLTVLTGLLQVTFIDAPEILLQPGDILDIPAGKKFAHKMWAINGDVNYIESAMSGCNDDAVRLEEVK